MSGIVVALALSGGHTMRKARVEAVNLIAGIGVEGDAHAGKTVKHRSRVARDPTQPNLRQVHLIHAELHAALKAAGFDIPFAAMGENVTTQGLDLLALPEGALLHLGPTAVVRVTGLRNPCLQLEGLAPGLMKAVLDRAPNGDLIRKAGIMGVVLEGGRVRVGDPIGVTLPSGPYASIRPV
jgi:MOSC domain-containing protein YiiM